MSSDTVAPPNDSASGGSEQRAALLQRQIKVWTGALVDLGGRNNLLYYRDLARGTLDLAKAAPERVADVLVGKPVSLAKLFPDGETRADAVKRARTVRNKANENFEERGLETLFLACGMATWTNTRGTATPSAPVLLVPARLAPRGAAQDAFDLSIVGELEVNPTLLQFIAAEFELQVDPEELLEQADIDGAIDTPEELDVVFDWLKNRASRIPGFDVTDRFVLGTFSYAKLPMVKDLEQSLEAMVQHELIAALAGDAEARANLATGGGTGENVPDPNHIPPADEFLILDADASQNYAINSAISGQNLIVRGPPGTGKSQTIANLIATLIARGQKVLFVAEKRAAIDAVLKRLSARKLDELVLDLHGGQGSRRKLAQDIAATLTGNGQIPKPDVAKIHRTVERRRQELNESKDAMHQVRAPWGVSVFDAYCRLLGIPSSESSEIRFGDQPLQALTGDSFEHLTETLEDFVGRGGLDVRTSSSPWAGADIRSAEQADRARKLVARLYEHTLPTVKSAMSAAASATGLQPSASLPTYRSWLDLWARADGALNIFDAKIFDEDLASLVAALEPMKEGGLKKVGAAMTSGEYRAARKLVKQHAGEHKPTYEEITAAAALKDDWATFAVADGAPAGLSDHAAVSGPAEQLAAELNELATFLPNEELLDADADDLATRLRRLLDDQLTLNKLPALHALEEELKRSGLAPLLTELERRRVDVDTAVTIFEHAWLSSILDEINRTDVQVGAFDGTQQQRAVEDYRAADRQHVETTAQRVRRLCAERAVNAQNDHREQAELVRYQAALKRKHMSIRELFGAAPDVLTTLKPCWVMSPLVVSQVLPADRPYFDVVVFDEASQIEPADAIPAILRGRSVVVAGDDRQLPPTSFFASNNPATDGDHADDGVLAVGADFESILDALNAFMPMRMLLWHYRSQDERLIAFSNAHFYDRSLTTFPGVTEDDCLRHIHVPFAAGQIGSEVSSSPEVNTVVDQILDHAEHRPTESLGVIAMGIKHADRIDEVLRTRLQDRPDLAGFFDESRDEKFFVKNLERVQGDERDAIILTIGYGKNADGRLLYRFGPLNNQGGERRLNVAVTRAKRRLTLVSSFESRDMDPEKGAEGVRLLRQYLQYAESRGANLGEAALEKPELNPFEIDVRDSLEKAGIPIVAQWGCSGYLIDYVAKHPTQPGRLVLAIECDGAAYHSSPSARDRDRLRQDHLERLGWTFHRIWSTDWFRNKAAEVERARQAYEAAVRAADEEPDPDANGRRARAGQVDLWEDEPVQPEAPDSTPAPKLSPWPPGVRRGLPIDDYTPGTLRSVVAYVKSDTLLRTNEELLAEVMHELRFRRRGSKIVARIQEAINASR